MSFVGHGTLARIDSRMREVRPAMRRVPFGGVSVILFGDHAQLPPVRDKRMFDDAVPDQPSAVGSVLYRHHFPVVVELTTVYRQLDRGFRELLNNVRSEEHTSELQSLMRISYAVFCLKKKNNQSNN